MQGKRGNARRRAGGRAGTSLMARKTAMLEASQGLRSSVTPPMLTLSIRTNPPSRPLPVGERREREREEREGGKWRKRGKRKVEGGKAVRGGGNE